MTDRCCIGFGNSSMIKYPIGGGHWAVRLHYLRWLKKHGYRFHWFELFHETRDSARNAKLERQFFRRIHDLGLSDDVFVLRHDRSIATPDLRDLHCPNRPQAELRQAVEEVDLLLNFCCALRCPLLDRFRRTALLDLDPGHLQVSALSCPMDIENHDVRFTVGLHLNAADCQVPKLSQLWHPFLPPVFLPDWPNVTATDNGAPFSTMTQWTWEELWWGERVLSVSKRTAYLQHLELPQRVGVPMELAVNLSPYDRTGDRQLLQDHGWRLAHPHRIARSPEAYRRYIQSRRGEFCCGKPIHKQLRSGWFSDRTAAFLASGRPAIFEDNEISEHLPVGEGLVTFKEPEEAVEAIERVHADYDRHCKAARAFAKRYLDATRILPAMIRVGLGTDTAQVSTDLIPNRLIRHSPQPRTGS